jgi:hypothetical protein
MKPARGERWRERERERESCGREERERERRLSKYYDGRWRMEDED